MSKGEGGGESVGATMVSNNVTRSRTFITGVEPCSGVLDGYIVSSKEQVSWCIRPGTRTEGAEVKYKETHIRSYV